jgi:hypothetical protein
MKRPLEAAIVGAEERAGTGDARRGLKTLKGAASPFFACQGVRRRRMHRLNNAKLYLLPPPLLSSLSNTLPAREARGRPPLVWRFATDGVFSHVYAD